MAYGLETKEHLLPLLIERVKGLDADQIGRVRKFIDDVVDKKHVAQPGNTLPIKGG